MKTGIFKLTVIAMMVATSAQSCTDFYEQVYPANTLPPETQTGENNIGFYLNGELMVYGRSWVTSPVISAEYDNIRDILTISAPICNQFKKNQILGH